MSNGGGLESGIPCPKCSSTKNRVVSSRQRNGGIYRRRKCTDCGKSFATHEVHAIGDFRVRVEPGSEKVVPPKVAVATEGTVAVAKPAPPQMRQVIVERNDNCIKCGRPFGQDVFRDWFDERRCQDCANEASEEQQP